MLAYSTANKSIQHRFVCSVFLAKPIHPPFTAHPPTVGAERAHPFWVALQAQWQVSALPTLLACLHLACITARTLALVAPLVLSPACNAKRPAPASMPGAAHLPVLRPAADKAADLRDAI